MPTVYRIFKTKHTATWSNGEGAFRSGGRWNLPGTRLLYGAGTLSLAALEMLVNIKSEELLNAYSFAEIQVADQLILPVERFRKLPNDWSGHPPPRTVQRIGSAWVDSMISAVLKVPTVILPGEFNYLVNIAHPDFARIRLGDPRLFRFDERLL